MTLPCGFSNRRRMRRLATLAFAAAFGAFGVFGVFGGLGPAEAANRVHGAVVDDTAKKVGEDRFKSTEDWEKTVRFFRNAYGGKPGIVWRVIETPPKVKAIHIANTTAKKQKGQWEGINIYETGNEIFIYVIRADDGGK